MRISVPKTSLDFNHGHSPIPLTTIAAKLSVLLMHESPWP